MNQQEKLASLSTWMVGAIVFVVLILTTVAIFGGQSGDAGTLGEQLQMAGEGDVTIAQQLPTCPSATPCMGKEFIPGTINYGETSVLSVTLVNTSTGGVGQMAFTDILTPGLVLASAPNSPQPCGGNNVVEGIAGGTAFTVSTSFLPAGTSCEITVTVQPTGVGTFVNSAANVTDTNNLDPDTIIPAQLQVDQAELIVVADDKQMWQGSNPPPLTGVVYGLVSPDTLADLDILPSLATTADNYSPAGLYPIFAFGGFDPNYTFTYIDGIMRVYINRFIEKKGMPVYPGGFGRHCAFYYRLR